MADRIRDRAVVRPDVRVCADVDDLSRRAAEAVVVRINDAVRTRGTCSIVLSGGNTPRTLYRLMASQRPSPIPWADVHVFWGDERYVPPEDPRSNFGMAKETPRSCGAGAGRPGNQNEGKSRS